MKVKGTIVITDPCYLKMDFPLTHRNTIYGDWSCMVYAGNINENKKYEEWNDYFFKFFNEYNFSNKTPEEKKAMSEEYNKFKEEWRKNILGEFCADAGEVGIFEWDRLHEENKEWCKQHPWCVTIIEDFDGEVDLEEINNEVHVIGKGNKPFFSVQSGF